MTGGAYQKIRDFVLYIRAMQESDLDVFTITSAKKGLGKSTLIIQIARNYLFVFGLKCKACKHEWVYTGKAIISGEYGEIKLKEEKIMEACPKCHSVENVEGVNEIDLDIYLAYDNSDVEKLIYELPEYSPIVADEGVRIMMGEDFAKGESKSLKRLFAQMRTKHLLFLVNIQKFRWIESKYRDDMATFWIRILKRGLNLILEPDLGEVDDPWHLKEFQDILGSYFYFTPENEIQERAEKLVNKHPCCRDWFKTPPLPADLYARYLEIRDRKAYEKKDPLKKLDQKEIAKIIIYNLIHNWFPIYDSIEMKRTKKMTAPMIEHFLIKNPKTGLSVISLALIKKWIKDVETDVNNDGPSGPEEIGTEARDDGTPQNPSV